LKNYKNKIKIMELIKTEKIFDSYDLLFFGEKVQAWGDSEEHSLEELVNNYIDTDKYPLKGQKEYEYEYNLNFTNFSKKD